MTLLSRFSFAFLPLVLSSCLSENEAALASKGEEETVLAAERVDERSDEFMFAPLYKVKIHVVVLGSAMPPGAVQNLVDGAGIVFRRPLADSNIGFDFDESRDMEVSNDSRLVDDENGAREAFASKIRGKVVIFLSDTEGGYSGSGSFAVSSKSGGSLLLAHELGHYFGLSHIFHLNKNLNPIKVGGQWKWDYMQTQMAIMTMGCYSYVIAGLSCPESIINAAKSHRDALLDGDGLSDTAPALWELPDPEYLDQCNPGFHIPLRVKLSNVNELNFDFYPQQSASNIMGYSYTVGSCATMYPPKFSNQQIQIMQSTLQIGGNRNHLLGAPAVWTGWGEIAGNGTTPSSPAAASFGGKVYAFIRNTSGKILRNSAQPGQAFGSWIEVQGNGNTDAAPAATSFNGRLYVAVKGTTGRIFLNSSSNGSTFGSWYEIQGNGVTDSAPNIAAFNGRLYAAVKGPTGRIFLNSSSDGLNFGSWVEVQGNGLSSSSVGITSFDSKLYLLARGSSGMVWHNWSQDGQTFGSWYEVQGGGTLGDSPAALSHNGWLHVFGRGAGDRLYVNTAPAGQAFRGWQEVSGTGVSNASPAATSLQDTLYLFTKGTNDNRVYVNMAKSL